MDVPARKGRERASTSAAGATRLPGLQSRLILLAGASIIPVLLLSLVFAWFLIQHELALFRQSALSRNRTFITALDAQVAGYIGTLRALAASNSLDSGDLAAFYRESTRVLAVQPDWRNILLLDVSGQQLMNLRFPYGAQLPRETISVDSVRAAVATRSVVIGQLAHGPGSNALGLAIRLPVVKQQQVRYVLQFVLQPEALERLLAVQLYPPDWTVALVDGNRRFIARQPYRSPGDEPSAELAAALQEAPENWYRGHTLEGRDTYTALSTSALTRWTVAVAIPVTDVYAAAYQGLRILIAATLLSLVLAIIVAHRYARKVAKPIDQLAQAARQLDAPGLDGALREIRAQAALHEVAALADAVEEGHRSILERQQLQQRERAALREADKAKDSFLAMLGHELRNPLSAIVTSAHVLRLSKPGAQSAIQAHDVIERQARHMTRLVEDLLDISRLATGKLTLHRERLDLGTLVQRVAQTWIASSESRAGLLECECDSVLVDGDRARLEQILTNLLDNAEKFSAHSGPIQVRVSAGERDAVLQVIDRGQGIEPEDIASVFDAFVQGHQDFDRPHGGIGLGLTLARRFAQMHGGSIEAFSAGANQGATFTVRLPRADVS